MAADNVVKHFGCGLVMWKATKQDMCRISRPETGQREANKFSPPNMLSWRSLQKLTALASFATGVELSQSQSFQFVLSGSQFGSEQMTVYYIPLRKNHGRSCLSTRNSTCRLSWISPEEMICYPIIRKALC